MHRILLTNFLLICNILIYCNSAGLAKDDFGEFLRENYPPKKEQNIYVDFCYSKTSLTLDELGCFEKFKSFYSYSIRKSFSIEIDNITNKDFFYMLNKVKYEFLPIFDKKSETLEWIRVNPEQILTLVVTEQNALELLKHPNYRDISSKAFFFVIKSKKMLKKALKDKTNWDIIINMINYSNKELFLLSYLVDNDFDEKIIIEVINQIVDNDEKYTVYINSIFLIDDITAAKMTKIIEIMIINCTNKRKKFMLEEILLFLSI